METAIGPIIYSDFSDGQMNNVNPNLIPPSAVELGLNVDFDQEIGSIVTRPGTTIVGSQLVASQNILGLHQYIDETNSSNNILLAAINASGGATSVIKNVVSGSSVVTGLTASKKMRFLTFLGATLAINGTDAEQSYAGSWITSGGAFDLANIPSSNTVKYPIDFLSRVYLAGDTTNPSRLYYSGVASGGTVSWTSGNGYIDVEQQDGAGAITGLGKVPGYLLIFKERAMHRWNFQSAFPEELVNIGTSSHESIVMSAGLCAFYSNSNENDKGFFVTNGGRPQPISHDVNHPIKKWVDAISSSTEANIAGWATNRYFAWSVGDVTVDGESYTNVVLKYNRLLNQWSVRTYPSEFKVFGKYLVSGVNTIVGGDDAGTVLKVDQSAAYTDNGTDINYKVRTPHSHFGKNKEKRISDTVYVRGLHLETANVALIPNRRLDNIIQATPPSGYTNILSRLRLGKTFNATTVSVQVSGTVKGASTTIHEIELPNVANTENYI